MIIELFVLFVVISFVLIYIGLTKPTESAQALTGFLFLFLLSTTLMTSNLEYSTSEQTNTSYIYNINSSDINTTIETTAKIYSKYDDTTGIFNTQRVGFYLAVASVIGFVGVIISIKSNGFGGKI